jgi:hypothetical protein
MDQTAVKENEVLFRPRSVAGRELEDESIHVLGSSIVGRQAFHIRTALTHGHNLLNGSYEFAGLHRIQCIRVRI